MTMADRERDRRSLQDLAKMAAMTPPPASVAPKSGIAKSPLSQPFASDDSGIVDLAAAAASDPAAEARAQQTPLASQGLFDDDAVNSQRPVQASIPAQPAPSLPPMPASMPPLPQSMAPVASVAPVPSAISSQDAAPARVQQPKKSSGAVVFLLVGGLVAASAAAAGGFFVIRNRQAPVAMTEQATPAPAVAAVTNEGDKKVAVAEPTPSPAVPGSDLNAVPTPTVGGKVAMAPKAGHHGKPLAAAAPKAPEGPPAAFAPPAPAKEEAPAPAKVAAKDLPKGGGESGDLNSEMHKAAGDLEKQTPAAQTTTGPAQTGNVPQKPSQGALQGAIGVVLPSARGCLGPDDPVSRASITFTSGGTVQGVTVSGGAVGKPAEACIKNALMKAKVQPFAEATYTANVTVRH